MPIIQGGPPLWVWERSPDPLRWDVIPSQTPDGRTVYELRLNCGLEILRLQFFTRSEMEELRGALGATSTEGARPQPATPERKEGVVSDPDFLTAG